MVAATLPDNITDYIPGDPDAFYTQLKMKIGVTFPPSKDGQKPMVLGPMSAVIQVHSVLSKVMDLGSKASEEAVNQVLDTVPYMTEEVC